MNIFPGRRRTNPFNSNMRRPALAREEGIRHISMIASTWRCCNESASSRACSSLVRAGKGGRLGGFWRLLGSTRRGRLGGRRSNPRGGQPQLVLDVGHRLHQPRAVPQERVRAAAELGVEAPRHREHLAALLRGELGRDQRAAALGRFRDHDTQGESADEAVAGGKAGALRRCAQGHLRDHRPLVRHALPQFQRVPRIGDVDTAGEHADGAAAGRERPPVGGRIGPHGEPAHHRHPPHGQVPRERLRGQQPIGSRPARADDADGPLLRAERPLYEERGRRVVDLLEAGGVLRVANGHETYAQSCHLRLPGGGVRRARPLQPRQLGRRKADRGGEIGNGRGEYLAGRPVSLQQGQRGPRREFRRVQHQPGLFLRHLPLRPSAPVSSRHPDRGPGAPDRRGGSRWRSPRAAGSARSALLRSS